MIDPGSLIFFRIDHLSQRHGQQHAGEIERADHDELPVIVMFTNVVKSQVPDSVKRYDDHHQELSGYAARALEEVPSAAAGTAR